MNKNEFMTYIDENFSIDGSASPAVYCYCNIPPQFIELIYDKTFDGLNPFS